MFTKLGDSCAGFIAPGWGAGRNAVAEPIDLKLDTVFCAYDFSETAEGALEQALRFARRHDAKLVLAHVVEPIPLGPYPAAINPNSELEIVNLARKRIEGIADSLSEEEIEVVPLVEQGQPGSQLISMAEANDADLIVIGTRGLTGLQHLALGSTAEYVVRKSECPVLTIHPEDRVLKSSIDTVVLPTDLSESAADAIEVFISIFGMWERPQVFLVYADRTPPYLEPFRHDYLARAGAPDVVKDKILKQLEPVADRLRAADFEVEVAVLDGDPVTVTSELAKECQADLVLLSTRGRGALANTLLGRTAQRIVQHAPCPVLTARPQGRVAAK